MSAYIQVIFQLLVLTLEYYWLEYLKIPVDAVDVEFASNLASLRSSCTRRKTSAETAPF